MIKTNEAISTGVSVATGGYAMFNIENFLSIVILILSIINIAWTLGYRLYAIFKEGRYEEVDKEIGKSINDLENLKDKGEKK